MTTLYHYTSSAGLMGIVKCGKIWASNIATLNDAMELRYVYEVANRVVNAPSPRLQAQFEAHPSLTDMIMGHAPSTDGPFLPDVYVASFSEVEDDLSQWRGYTNPGDGYTIEFDSSQLEGLTDLTILGERLAPVIYEEARADEEVENLLLEIFDDRDANPEQEDWVAHSAWLMKLYDLAPTLKHPKFKAEQEWRLIISESINRRSAYGWVPRNHEIHWRAGKSFLIPYIEFDLRISESMTSPNSPVVKGFTVGPGPNADLATKALLGFVNLKGYGEGHRIRVKTSEIPYRPW